MSTAYNHEKHLYHHFTDMFGIYPQTSNAYTDSNIVAVDGCLLSAPNTYQTHIQDVAALHNPIALSQATNALYINLPLMSPIDNMIFTEFKENVFKHNIQLYPNDVELRQHDPEHHFNECLNVAESQVQSTNNAPIPTQTLSKQVDSQQGSRFRRNAVFIPRVVSDTICQLYNKPTEPIPTIHIEHTSTVPKDMVVQHIHNKRSRQSPRLYSRGYDSKINAILYEWLYENIDHPFPSPQDKQELMRKTGLTKMQLKNWLCNVRRRKLPNSAHGSKNEKYK